MNTIDKVIDDLLEAEVNDYFSIGHRTDGKPVFLWIWKDGKLETHEIIKDETHYTVWDGIDTVTWGGRYDPQTKQVSLTNMSSLDDFRGAPKIIYRNLRSEFGDDIDVREASYEL